MYSRLLNVQGCNLPKKDWENDDQEVGSFCCQLRPPREKCTSAQTSLDWGYSHCPLFALGSLCCYVHHIILMTVSNLPANLRIPSLNLINCFARYKNVCKTVSQCKKLITRYIFSFFIINFFNFYRSHHWKSGHLIPFFLTCFIVCFYF